MCKKRVLTIKPWARDHRGRLLPQVPLSTLLLRLHVLPGENSRLGMWSCSGQIVAASGCQLRRRMSEWRPGCHPAPRVGCMLHIPLTALSYRSCRNIPPLASRNPRLMAGTSPSSTNNFDFNCIASQVNTQPPVRLPRMCLLIEVHYGWSRVGVLLLLPPLLDAAAFAAAFHWSYTVLKTNRRQRPHTYFPCEVLAAVRRRRHREFEWIRHYSTTAEYSSERANGSPSQSSRQPSHTLQGLHMKEFPGGVAPAPSCGCCTRLLQKLLGFSLSVTWCVCCTWMKIKLILSSSFLYCPALLPLSGKTAVHCWR